MASDKIDSSMRTYEKVQRCKEYPYGLSPLAKGTLLDKPTILFLGGNYACSSDQDVSNASAGNRLISTLIGRVGVHEDDIRQCAVTYPLTISELMEACADHNEEYLAEDHCEPMIAKFISQQILPSIAEEGTADNLGRIPRKRISFELIKKRLRNLHIITHSAGGVVGEQLGNGLVSAMRHIGYSEDEIKEAANQVLLVNVGSISNGKKGQANFTRIDIINAYDGIAAGKGRSVELTKDLLAKKGRIIGNHELVHPINIVENPQSKSFVTVLYNGVRTTRLTNGAGFLYADNTGTWAEDGKLLKIEQDNTVHSLKTYLAYKPSMHGMIIPLMVQNILINGMNNALENSASNEFIPLPSPTMLMQLPDSIKFTQAEKSSIGIYGSQDLTTELIEYNRRIREAYAGDDVSAFLTLHSDKVAARTPPTSSHKR